MKFKLSYDKLEDIPEAIREVATKAGMFTQGSDGRFYFAGDLQEEHPALAGLRNGLSTERTNRENFERQLREFTAIGKTPAELQALATAKPPAPGKGVDVEALRTEIRTELAAETQRVLAEKDERIRVLTGAVSENLHKAQVVGALTKAGVKRLTLIEPHAIGRTKVEEKDGKFRVVVIDPATGKVRYDANGAEVSLDRLAEEMKADPEFAPAWPGTGAAGGGADGEGQRDAGAGKKVIARGDADAFAANMEGIAKGEVVVQ